MPSQLRYSDEDVRITDLNEVAASISGHEKEAILRRRGGEVFHCLHSTTVAGGCGKSPSCKLCVIRNSVNVCLQGQTVSRARMKMEFLPVSEKGPMELLTTASPMSRVDFSHGICPSCIDNSYPEYRN